MHPSLGVMKYPGTDKWVVTKRTHQFTIMYDLDGAPWVSTMCKELYAARFDTKAGAKAHLKYIKGLV